MHKVLEGVDIVAFDIMGVVLTSPSLVREGLYLLYKDNYSYEFVKELYRNVRSNTDGDMSLWEGLGESNPLEARRELMDSYRIDNGFQEFRELLDKIGLRKGIISNMPKEWAEFLIEKLDFKKDFNPILFSGIVGLKKAEEEIYSMFIKESGIDGKRVLFIDDKLENLEMGKKFGFKTVLFDRGIEQIGFEPDLVIKSFRELM